MPSFINIFNKRISDTGAKGKQKKEESGKMHKRRNPCGYQKILENGKIFYGLCKKNFVNY